MFCNKKGCYKFQKPFYEYFNFHNFHCICLAMELWSHSNKKSQEDLKNGIMRALEITNQNNLLAIAFPALAYGVFGLSTDMCATIMLRTMRDFITENSNFSLKLIRVIANNIRQVKTFARVICYIICAEEFIFFYSFICWIFEYLETWFIKIFSQIVFKVNTLPSFSIFENCLNYILSLKKFDSPFLFVRVINIDLIEILPFYQE